MATLEEGLVAYALADAGLVALQGERFYALKIPQDASLPASAYQRISGPRDQTHSGPSGLVMARMQITIQGESYEQAKAVAGAFRRALDGFRHGWWGSVRIERCFLENDVDAWADRLSADVVRQDYSIWYQE